MRLGCFVIKSLTADDPHETTGSSLQFGFADDEHSAIRSAKTIFLVCFYS